MNKSSSRKTSAPAAAGSAAAAGAPREGVRLQLLLATAGVASRRHAAAMIRAGCVRVNGKVVLTPGWRVDPAGARVTVKGVPLPAAQTRRRTVMLHKPAGVICSADAAQGRTVCDLVAELPERLVPVGRLDKESSGLLLLSNDGDLIARLTHPRFGHGKLYEVVVEGDCGDETLARLRAPMVIDGYRLQPVEVRRLHCRRGRAWLRFELREGRNRQIRKMCAQVGLRVRSLARVGIDNLRLGNLPPGAWRDLSETEVSELLR